MVRTQVQLTEEQSKLVREIARRYGISQAEVIRRAVDLISRSGVLPDREEIRKRALAAIGSVRGDVTDVSTRHDEYFAEASL